MTLANKTVIVTGGSKGYGRGIAAALRNAGANVWITGRNAEALQFAAAELDVRAIRADVTSGNDWDSLFAQISAETGGTLDMLVNNAGAGVTIAPVHEQTDDAIINAVNINLTGAILGARRAAALMVRQQSGMIINISSVCALHAWPGWSVYTAAKAGLSKFGHGLHVELRPYNVRVTTITPSWGATDFDKAASLEEKNAATAQKCIQPAEVGKLVVDLFEMPPHLVVPDITIQPMIQEISPM